MIQIKKNGKAYIAPQPRTLAMFPSWDSRGAGVGTCRCKYTIFIFISALLR
jgi:hypothetical protein